MLAFVCFTFSTSYCVDECQSLARHNMLQRDVPGILRLTCCCSICRGPQITCQLHSRDGCIITYGVGGLEGATAKS